jgi:putative membrane protein
MIETTLSSLAGFGDFLLYFVLAMVLLCAFWRIYIWLTPHDEMALVRDNNVAAAVALSGALIGFALPLAGAITHSVVWLDSAIWGVVALIMQALTFVVLRLTLPQLPQRIAKGEMAAAVLTAGVSISVGMLNAASMTYY